MKFLSLISILFLFYSCSSIQKQLYGVNKHRFFDTKEEAVKYFKKKNRLNPDKVYFFETEKERVRFMQDIDSKRENIVYYKMVLNDSIRIDDSSIIDKTCIGSIETFITNYHTGYSTINEDELRNFKLTNYKNKVLDLNINIPTIIFVVDNNLGKLINVSANYITDEIDEKELDINYIYISTDAIISQLKISEKAKQ